MNNMLMLVLILMWWISTEEALLQLGDTRGLRENTTEARKRGHSGEYGNAAKLVRKMSKSVMQLVSIHF